MLGLLRYMGYQRYGTPKGMAFGLFMCEKGVNFIHIGLIIEGVFFTLAWHWVLNTY